MLKKFTSMVILLIVVMAVTSLSFGADDDVKNPCRMYQNEVIEVQNEVIEVQTY